MPFYIFKEAKKKNKCDASLIYNFKNKSKSPFVHFNGTCPLSKITKRNSNKIANDNLLNTNLLDKH